MSTLRTRQLPRAETGPLCSYHNLPISALRTVGAGPTLAEWRQAAAVDLDGPFLVTQAILEAMIALRRGSIVNVLLANQPYGFALRSATSCAEHLCVSQRERPAWGFHPSHPTGRALVLRIVDPHARTR